MKGKKFIAPGAWFDMVYPADWSEFEDGEGSFLFYNPDKWTGNFRISAFRGNDNYGKECVDLELKENRQSRILRIGKMDCAYSVEQFTEEDGVYENHQWVTGSADVAFEISFAIRAGDPVDVARNIIESLHVRHIGVKYPAEVIPVRLSEILQIDEAFDWVQEEVKQLLKKDFRAEEEDVENMQRLVESGKLNPKKRDAWIALGITLCVILANEVEGMEWRTLVDGNREAPVMVSVDDEMTLIDPMKLVWSRVKAGEKIDLVEIYKEIL